MLQVSRLSLSAFPDSPYAAELRRGGPGLRFSPRLEAEYVHAHLVHSRTLIRVACLVAALLGVLRSIELAVAPGSSIPIALGLVVAGSVVLAVIAWTSLFERHYLPWARLIVPLRSALMAVYVARAASHGQTDMLMVLLPALIGPFFFLGLPFRTGLLAGSMAVASFTIGVIAFQLPLPVAVRSCGFLYMGLAACAIAALCLEKRSRTSFLESQLIAQIAEQDSLTGTKNRRVFDEHLAGLWSRAIEERRCLSILLIDVDHFKAYNDCYGHQAGDRALRRVSQAVQTFIRSPLDILARYGGEEFAAVLYDVDGRKAKDIADQMRCAVEDLRIEHRGSRSCAGVTISVGVAAIEPTRERDPSGALQLADQALYDAKTHGRNRVALMNEAEYRMLVTGVFSRDAVRAAQ